MYCPRCGSERVDGVARCAECDAPLVTQSLQRDEPEGAGVTREPVAVFTTSKTESILIAKSILMDAGIEYGVRGEDLQDLFGYGRFPAGNNVFIGPMQVLVAPEDAADATQLLAALSSGESLGHGADADAPAVPADKSFRGGVRHWTRILVVGLLALSALGLIWGLIESLLDAFGN